VLNRFDAHARGTGYESYEYDSRYLSSDGDEETLSATDSPAAAAVEGSAKRASGGS
jgi:hypothetical protein